MSTSGYMYYGASGNTSKYFSIFRNDQYNEIAHQIQIDDVRVFNTRLTAGEISYWMDTSVNGSTNTGTLWLISS